MGRGRGTRALVGLAPLVAVVLVGSGPAPAQAADLPVISSIGGPFIIDTVAYVDCEGVEHLGDSTHGFMVLDRVDPSSSALEPVEVGVSYSGDLADDLVEAPASVTVSPADNVPTVGFVLPPRTGGSLTITLEPGPGYELGDQISGTATVGTDVRVLADCTDLLDLPPEVVDQSIAVGEKPVDLPLPIDTIFFGYEIIGDPPPGLDLDHSYRWQGAATTPGTYALTVRLCDLVGRPGLPQDAHICDGTAQVRIVVEGQGGTGPGNDPTSPVARPATPVAAAATLTG
jgi:hypothetical protein